MSRLLLRSIKLSLLLLFALSIEYRAMAASVTDKNEAAQNVKQELLSLAESYKGLGDPDFSKQQAIEALVQKLVVISPPPPIKDRLTLLYGAWKQVWGPYDYRNNARGVDPELGVDEIYQVVFKEGYYYNVSPNFKNGDKTRERIGFLRGEYKLDPRNENLLRVKFTNLTGIRYRPKDKELWELPVLVEANRLQGRTTLLPGFLVRLFFRGGALQEVYTDEDMRILYGSDGKHFDKRFVYVMTRAK